ncbi:hypothetical protein CF67_29007 (plasmid) [Candidatus Photodesmus blepharus]|uniref:Uncharacterized protein n=1 Tax=Candidatus Photodesmus blepharonis TaxID=1179155 RepID=A0A084CMC8_9GAMM|nr:DNA mismatch repair protein [Candidatus Photodesmus blepharus]KEY90957.1 hypothetical protein CF67_29007 [Candidatus Photodesmus blepharus]
MSQRYSNIGQIADLIVSSDKTSLDSGSKKTLTVVSETNRKNNFISSLLLSRMTIFHPSQRPTPYMIRRLSEIAKRGGTNFLTPLESQVVSVYGKDYQIDLFVDYLLQGHRDLLDTLLAFSTTITLDETAYKSGKKFTWSEIIRETLPEGNLSSIQHDNFDVLNTGSVVLSISMYDLAKRMGIMPHRSSYNMIEKRISQLAGAFITVSELDEENNFKNRSHLRFIQDFRFLYDNSKNKNGKAKKNTNHLFIVPDNRLLKAIRDQGYFYRKEQYLMCHYSKPSVRSFLKYLRTHQYQFINGKTFEWLLSNYIASIPSPVSKTFKNDLKKSVISVDRQIESDFSVQLKKVDGETRIFYVGDER